MTDVMVIGDVDTDIYLDLPCIPGVDDGVLANRVTEYPGGKGANTAAALNRLGTSAGILAKAGDDHHGQVVIESLKAYGVDLAGLKIVRGGKTGSCIMMLNPDGEKAVVAMHTDLTYPEPHEIEASAGLLCAARHVHAIGLQPQKMSAGLKMARQAGLSTSVDLDCALMGLEKSREVMAHATLVFINEQGMRNFFPRCEFRDALEELSRMGPEMIALTRGRDGVLLWRQGEILEASAVPIQAMDATGAGDCFAAAFLHGYLAGWHIERILSFSCAAAAIISLEMGPQTNLPTQETVLRFMQARGL